MSPLDADARTGAPDAPGADEGALLVEIHRATAVEEALVRFDGFETRLDLLAALVERVGERPAA